MAAAQNPSQKILNEVVNLANSKAETDEKGTKYERDVRDWLAVQLSDLNQKIELLNAKLDASKARSKSATNGAAPAKTATTPSTETTKYYSNSMYYFIGEWKNRKADLVKEFLNDEIMKATNNFMENSTEAKAKQGPAKADFEAKHIWNTYIKNNDTLKNKIKEVFTQGKANHEKSHMSQAVKESDNA